MTTKTTTAARGLAPALTPVRLWPLRRWLVALAAATATALALGIPTDIVPTPLYTRMTPVTWWNYPIWAATAVLFGLVAVTYVRVGPVSQPPGQAGRALGGGMVSLFAIGCPICNKLVVAVLGISGALSYFGPVQPFLGAASVALLSLALAVRLRGEVACHVSAVN
jgi:hypothetical protein